METNFLYFAHAEKELDNCITPEMRSEWQRLRSIDGVDSFTTDAESNFCPGHVV